MELVEPSHLDAGARHLVELRRIHLVAADPVEQHVRLHAGARTFGERVGELPADRAGPVDEALEVDARARVLDGGEHGREDAVAIQQHLHAVAADDCGSEQYAHRAPEVRIGGGVEAPDSLPDSLLAMAEIQGDDRRRESNAGRGKRNERQPGFHSS